MPRGGKDWLMIYMILKFSQGRENVRTKIFVFFCGKIGEGMIYFHLSVKAGKGTAVSVYYYIFDFKYNLRF